MSKDRLDGVEIRHLRPGDEQFALQVVRNLIPADERDGREPGIGHLQRLPGQDTNYTDESSS